MTDKNVVIIEPTASDIQAITIIYDGAGNPTSVDVSCAIRTSDGEVSHTGNCTTVPADYSAASQIEMSAMAVTAAAKVSAVKNFPTV